MARSSRTNASTSFGATDSPGITSTSASRPSRLSKPAVKRRVVKPGVLASFARLIPAASSTVTMDRTRATRGSACNVCVYRATASQPAGCRTETCSGMVTTIRRVWIIPLRPILRRSFNARADSIDAGSQSPRGSPEWSPIACSARSTSGRPPATRATHGWPVTQRPQRRHHSTEVRRNVARRTRPQSMRAPSVARTPGSSVVASSADVTTTRRPAAAIARISLSGTVSSTRKPRATVAAESRIVWPACCAASAAAALGSRPSPSASRNRLTISSA